MSGIYPFISPHCPHFQGWIRIEAQPTMTCLLGGIAIVCCGSTSEGILKLKKTFWVDLTFLALRQYHFTAWKPKNHHNMSQWCAFWFPWSKVAANQSFWSTWISTSKRAFAILRLSRIQMSRIIIIRLSGTRRLSLQRGRKKSREWRKVWLRARWMLYWTPGSFQRLS